MRDDAAFRARPEHGTLRLADLVAMGEAGFQNSYAQRPSPAPVTRHWCAMRASPSATPGSDNDLPHSSRTPDIAHH